MELIGVVTLFIIATLWKADEDAERKAGR